MTTQCYGINQTASGVDRLILIKRGEIGFYPTEGYGANSEKLVDFFNYNLGVDRATRQAMEIASMFGSNIPGADPERFRDLFPAGEREPTEQERRDAQSVLGHLGDSTVSPAQASLAMIINRHDVVPLGLFAEVQRQLEREGA